MRIDTIHAPKGANRGTKRVGRGRSSGMGKTCCRGMNGQKSRSGSSIRPGFQGGQMPLYRRLPKRGMGRGHKANMCSHFKVPYLVVNVKDLNAFDVDATVGPKELRDRGLVGSLQRPIKILGDGQLTRSLIVRAHAFSASAICAIEEAGGHVDIVTMDMDIHNGENGPELEA